MSDSELTAGRTSRQTLMAALIGNTIEFYSFFIYANAAALVFAPLFFPAVSPWTQQLGAWATFAIAFLARPAGGVLFGHLGDRHGRHVGLAASLLLMGGSTITIGLLPTFEQVGWVATALLCMMRVGQGLALGGEWGGAVLIAVERAPARRRTLFGMVPQLGAPLGLLLADGVFLVLDLALSPEAFARWGWRIPFLLTAPLILVVRRARKRLAPEMAASFSHRSRIPARAVLDYWPALFAGTLAAMLGFVLFYLFNSFALAHAVISLGLRRAEVLACQIGGALCMAAGIVIGTILATRIGRTRVMAIAAAAAALLGASMIPMSPWDVSPSILLALPCVALLLHGLGYGPLGSWLPELFPPHVRYTGASLGFNMAGVLGGALTPLIAQTLLQQGGFKALGLFVSVAAILALAATAVGSMRMMHRSG